jgi:hypothetical protein
VIAFAIIGALATGAALSGMIWAVAEFLIGLIRRRMVRQLAAEKPAVSNFCAYCAAAEGTPHHELCPRSTSAVDHD